MPLPGFDMANNVKLFVMAKTASSAVYNINYHLVWCPKYRKKILVGKLKEFLDQQIQNIAESTKDTRFWR